MDGVKNCETCYWSDGLGIDEDSWCDKHEMYVPNDYSCSGWKSREDQDE